MTNIKLRKVIKINSARLRNAKWNLDISLSEARANNELVAISESTLLRFIDNINGVDTDKLYDRQADLVRRFKMISKQEKSDETKKEIRCIRNEINKILYIPELVMVVIDSEKDYWRAVEGFSVNGINYKRLLATSAGVKLRTVVFCDIRIIDKLKVKLDNGRDLNMPLVPAKLESYKGLALSASTPVSTPLGVVVVKDCITKFKSNYIQLSDGDDGGEPIMETIIGGDVELDNSDGYGLISPSMAEIWSAELGLNETAGGFCVRNAFCKGMLFVFDFVKFAEEIAGNYYVEDVWGVKRNVLDADIILTESQLKLWDSYKSIEHYMTCCSENGYTFSVTKAAENKLKEYRETNYQYLQSISLTDDEIYELIEPTIDDISGVMGGDVAKAVLYLKGTEMTEKSVMRLEDDYVKALMINKEVINDPYIRANISRLISTKIDRTKLGRIRVRGDFMIVSGDPYALCQSMFGMNVTGILSGGEVYAKYWTDRNVDKIVAMRSPMSVHNSLRIMNVVSNDDTYRWFNHMGSVMITNCWDMLANSLNGMDYDGDTVFSTDNKVIMDNIRDTLPINCVQRKATKMIATDNDFITANIVAFGDSSSSIGSITNRITSMYDRLEEFPVGSEERNIIEYRLVCGQQYQQNSIDRAKGVISDSMPKYWYNSQAARKEDEKNGTDINSKIVADKKSYFFRYRYSDTNSQLTKYESKCAFDCMWKFGCTISELRAKEELTEDEENYLKWYYKNSPVSIGNGVMNRLCWIVEDITKDIKDEWSVNTKSFNYGMYRSEGVEYTGEEFNAIRNILDDYFVTLKNVPHIAKESRMDDVEISEYRRSIVEETKQECYCNCTNGKTLCNIVLDYCFAKRRSCHVIWDMCGDVIVSNLLDRANGFIRYYVPSDVGDIDYKGQKFEARDIYYWGD